MNIDRLRRDRSLLLAGFVLAGVSLAGAFESPAGLLEKANRAVRDGRLSRALELYEEADELRPDDAHTLYNWGTALAMGDERGLAERMFRKADKLAPNDDLRARARFNLAHSLFVTASTLTEEDPQRAIELFDASARAAKSTLEIDRGDVEAARHVEISRLAAKLVRDQLELAERLEELASQQRDQSQASQDTHRDREEPREDGESSEQERQPLEQPAQSDGGDEQGQEQGEDQDGGGMPDLPSWLRGLFGPERDDPEGSPEQEDRPEQDQQAEEQESETPEADGQETPEQPPENPGDDASDQTQNGPGGQPDENPPEGPPGAGLGEAQQELSDETEGIAETLRRAIENDLVAGDRDFAEAVLRAIEEARNAQDDAKENLDEQQFADASADQEQAATLLELAQEMMEGAGGERPPPPQDPNAGDPRQGPNEGEQEGDAEARRLLDKEQNEREMRRNYQRRIMRGRRAPARDW